jgi:hypothetical protein
MFPVGDIANLLVSLVDPFVSLATGSDVAGAAVAALPVFALALPLGAAHGFLLWLLVQLIKKLFSLFRRASTR